MITNQKLRSSPRMQARHTIIMVAKYPTPGHCKTRLSKETGTEFAANFSKCSTQDLLQRLALFADPPECIRLVLLYAPKERGDDFRTFLLEIPGALTFGPQDLPSYRRIPEPRGREVGALGDARPKRSGWRGVLLHKSTMSNSCL